MKLNLRNFYFGLQKLYIYIDTKADRAVRISGFSKELPAVIRWLRGYRTAMEHQQK